MSTATLSETTSEALPAPHLTEDWLAVIIGLLIYGAALLNIQGYDLLDWAVTTSVWTGPAKGLGTVSKAYAALGGPLALVATYAFLLAVLTASAALLKTNVVRFALVFSVLFWLAHACWFTGSYAMIAAVTPAGQAKFGIPWSLKLTNEAGLLVALIAGMAIANFLPRLADWLKEAALLLINNLYPLPQ